MIEREYINGEPIGDSGLILQNSNNDINNTSNQTQNINSKDKRVSFYSGQELESSKGFVNPFPTNKNENTNPPKYFGPPSVMAIDDLTNINDNNLSSYDGGYAILTLFGRDSNISQKIGTHSENLKDRNNNFAWYDVSEKSKTPTTKEIIEYFKNLKNPIEAKKRPYKYSDFVFLKYYNKIPNNRLITLRRYAQPVFDNLKFPNESLNDGSIIVTPIAQALTYIGNETENKLSQIISFTVEVPYDEVESKMHEINEQMPGSHSFWGKFLAVFSGTTSPEKVKTNGEFQDPYNNGPYMNRVFGPINRIDKTQKRKPGLNFNQELKLNFHYVARPIDGVNTKAIMLDILANLLLLTYNDASWWGGDYRFIAGSPAYPFPGSAQKFWGLDPKGYFDSLVEQIQIAGSNIKDGFTEFFGAVFESLKGGDFISILKTIGGSKPVQMGAKYFMAEQVAKIKPFLPQLPALLAGFPVGEYHLTIGNPLNPILEIGNLVCTSAEFSFSDELGPDDFPLEMKVTITLKHGMPRDRSAIQSMFNRGYGKIYSFPDKIQDIVDRTSGSKESETAVDNITKKLGKKNEQAIANAFAMAMGNFKGNSDSKK